MAEFNFKSEITSVQNNLITQAVRDSSNITQMRTEEAIKAVIDSYISKFSAQKGKLLDASKLVVESEDIVRVDVFNDLFLSVFVDLSALYSELENVDKVLNLNLQRNKNYFLMMKKRIRDMWNKLFFTRTNVYDLSAKDVSFFESFNTTLNAKQLHNLNIDKKNGFMYLKYDSRDILNKQYLIKDISTVTYPVHNVNGGVRRTTDQLNTFEYNYTDGPRDMLNNGLFKEQLICSDIPDMIVNIGSSDNPIEREFKGIVSIVDIEFVYPIELNRLDVDLFGDFPTDISAILIKDKQEDSWKILQFVGEIDQTSLQPTTPIAKDLRSSKFDIVSFLNVVRCKTKFMRVVFNQKYYELLDSSATKTSELENAIQQDLAERRYDVVKLSSMSRIDPRVPVNVENQSLYEKIIHVIETTSEIEKTLTKIINIIDPQQQVIKYDFKKLLKYEVGAWSIEPIREIYSQTEGLYESLPYSLKTKPLLSASLTTKESTPATSTCSWYISVNNKDIPIIPGDLQVIKESINVVNMQNLSNFSTWTGTFILLNHPVQREFRQFIQLYEHDTLIDIASPLFLNSRLLYIDSIKNHKQYKYVIRYPVAFSDTVSVFVPQRNPGSTIQLDLSHHVVSSRKEILNALLNRSNIGGIPASSQYTIVPASATLQECKEWFQSNFSKGLFISSEALGYYSQSANTLITTLVSGDFSGKFHTGDTTNFNSLSLVSTTELISMPPLPITLETI